MLSFEKGLEVKNLELVHLFSIVCFVYTALVMPTFKVKIKVLVSLIYNNQFYEVQKKTPLTLQDPKIAIH